LGITASGYYKRKKQSNSKKEELGVICHLIDEIRRDHPRMGLEVIYNKINPKEMGRDKFVRTFRDLGYGVREKRKFIKTTDSSGVKRFDNKIIDLELKGINQCFVSDITYFEMNNQFYYLTFIMDLFNREVVGYSTSKSLRTDDTTLPAVGMLIKNRGAKALEDAIFHSDGGGQYYANDFIHLTQEALKMTPSMGKICFDNPHAERLNGVLKNNYLIPYGPTNFPDLVRKTQKAVFMYNNEKPHKALKGMTPKSYKTVA